MIFSQTLLERYEIMKIQLNTAVDADVNIVVVVVVADVTLRIL